MLDAGYKVLREDGVIRLYRQPVAWWGGSLLPYTFRSLQAAAEYLCPIVADDSFTKAITTGEIL